MSASERLFPRSLIEFRSRFATESTCVHYLFERGWPEGFVCPGCDRAELGPPKSKAFTYVCADASVTDGAKHSRQQPAADDLVLDGVFDDALHGISALQLQNRLGLGSCRTAWMLRAKPGQRHRAERDRVVRKLGTVVGNQPGLKERGRGARKPGVPACQSTRSPSAEHVAIVSSASTTALSGAP